MSNSEENSPQENPTPDADEPWQLVYIAKNLKEAQRLEQVLSDAGLDYSVEPDEYIGGLIFRRTLIGAFFYVPEVEARQARAAMTRARFRVYEA